MARPKEEKSVVVLTRVKESKVNEFRSLVKKFKENAKKKATKKAKSAN